MEDKVHSPLSSNKHKGAFPEKSPQKGEEKLSEKKDQKEDFVFEEKSVGDAGQQNSVNKNSKVETTADESSHENSKNATKQKDSSSKKKDFKTTGDNKEKDLEKTNADSNSKKNSNSSEKQQIKKENENFTDIPEEKRPLLGNEEYKDGGNFPDQGEENQQNTPDKEQDKEGYKPLHEESKGISAVLMDNIHKIEDGAKTGVEIAKHQLERLSSSETATQVKEAISTTFEKSKELTGTVQQAIVSTASTVIEKTTENLTQENIAHVYHTIIEKSKQLVETVKSEDFQDNVKEKVSHVIETSKETISNAFESSKETISSAIETSKETVAHAWETGSEKLSQAAVASKEVLGNVIHDAQEKVSTTIEKVKDGELQETVKEKVSSMIEGAKGVASKVADPEFRGSLNESVKENIKTATTTVVTAISTITQTIKEEIKQSSFSAIDNSEDNLTKIEPLETSQKNATDTSATNNLAKEVMEVHESQNDSDEEEDFGVYSKKKSPSMKNKLE